MALTDYEDYIRTDELQLPIVRQAHDLYPKRIGDHGMTGRAHARAGTLSAITLIAALSAAPGCSYAVNHPAIAAGVVGGTLGLATCKLASDNIGACFLVGGGAGAFLGLVAATAIWLGGDGHSVLTEEQAQPLPDDGRPRKRRHRPPPVDPDAPPASPTSPTPASPTPASPANPTPATPASPTPASPANPTPASPAIPSPASPIP